MTHLYPDHLVLLRRMLRRGVSRLTFSKPDGWRCVAELDKEQELILVTTTWPRVKQHNYTCYPLRLSEHQRMQLYELS